MGNSDITYLPFCYMAEGKVQKMLLFNFLEIGIKDKKGTTIKCVVVSTKI